MPVIYRKQKDQCLIIHENFSILAKSSFTSFSILCIINQQNQPKREINFSKNLLTNIIQFIYYNLIYYSSMKTVNVKSLGECPYLVSLQAEDSIGHGSYAHVCRAYNKKKPEQKLAVKIFDLKDVKKFESAFKQLTIVCNLPRQENLVEYKKIKITSKHRLYIIMELCEESLKARLLKNSNYYSQNQIWHFLIQFAEGYKILSKRGIVHRDIKPDNILIGLDGVYKISDFGLAQVVQQMSINGKVKGSLCYLAPQFLSCKNQMKHVNNLIDVYSLGVTVYEICFRRLPYIRNLQSIHSIEKFISEIRYNSLKFPTCKYSSQLLNLISSMLERQQAKRCTWQYIFYTLMKKYENMEPKIKEIQVETRQSIKFRVIQISDAFLKNLSKLDTELYKSLTNESLTIIDHVQAELISKRQIVFFCDRLQYRLEIINEKLKIGMIDTFSARLLKYTFYLSEHLEKYFQKYYEKMERNQFLKVVTSQKYTFIRNLIHQDFYALKEQVSLLQTTKFEFNPQLYQNQQQFLEVELYGGCFSLLTKLYELKYYQQCKQIDELQKWLQNKEKSESILSKVRKNENALKQFYQQIGEMTKDRLKQYISAPYIHHLKKIDRIYDT